MPARVGAVGRAMLVLSAALALTYGLVSRDWYNAGISHYALAALKASGIFVLAVLALSRELAPACSSSSVRRGGRCVAGA